MPGQKNPDDENDEEEEDDTYTEVIDTQMIGTNPDTLSRAAFDPDEFE